MRPPLLRHLQLGSGHRSIAVDPKVAALLDRAPLTWSVKSVAVRGHYVFIAQHRHRPI